MNNVRVKWNILQLWYQKHREQIENHIEKPVDLFKRKAY